MCSAAAVPREDCDVSFPPTLASLGDMAAHRKAAWRRLSELYPGAKLFVSDPAVGRGHDVVQGSMGDCFLVAAMALLSQRCGLLERLVRAGERPGMYVVKFALRGGWEEVEVDDLIPVDASTNKPLFAHSRSGSQLCFSILEKAMAKRYGSYSALSGGNTSEALYDLTGLPVEDYSLDKMLAEEGRQLLEASMASGHLVALGFIDTTCEGEVRRGVLGLRKNHAYAAVGIRASELLVYNPSGSTDGFEGDTDGKGMYTIPLSRLKGRAAAFNRLHICLLGDRYGSGEDGLADAAEQHVFKDLRWDAAMGTSGGCTNFRTFHMNPTLTVDFSGKGVVRLMVGQNDLREAVKGSTGKAEDKMDYPQLGITVLRLSDGAQSPMLTPERYTVVSKTAAFWNKREVALGFQVDGPGALAVVPSTYSPGISTGFWFSLLTTAPLACAPSWSSMAHNLHITTWSGSTDSNRVRLHCQASQPGADVLVFVEQHQADLVPVGVHFLRTSAPTTRDSTSTSPSSAGEAPDGLLLQTSSFVKAGVTSFSVTLPESTTAFVAVPCTMQAKQKASITATLCCSKAVAGSALTFVAKKDRRPIGEVLSEAAGASQGKEPTSVENKGSTPSRKPGPASPSNPRRKKTTAASSGGGCGNKMSMAKAKATLGSVSMGYSSLE